jgi:hypothetical protein
LPTPHTTEITVLDINFASLFFDDFQVLNEGVTGNGKSYVADALGTMICGPDGYLNLTLSGGAMGTSAVEPFTKTILENRIPKIRIDLEKCAKYGIIFLDEINAGDFKDTSRVVEGVAQINGQREYLRLPIPGTDKFKKIPIIAAMNPSDALHSHARELSIAGENRFLKFRFPNGAEENPSSQPDSDISDYLHEQFWQEFREKTRDSRSWRDIYPLVTDPQQFLREFDGVTKEFIDVVMGYVGKNPLETFERNVSLMKQGGVEPNFSIRKDNEFQTIVNAQNTLKHGFVRRDVKKIRNLSRLLGFIKSIKDKSYEPHVSLNDATASVGMILESKAVTGTNYGGLMTLVNDGRRSYEKSIVEMRIPKNYGVRQTIWQAAVNSSTKHGFKGYISTIQKGISLLNTQSPCNISQAVEKSRLIADLVVLKHFSETHQEEVDSALKSEDAFLEFTKVYDKNKNEGSVYERLDSIVR